MAGVMLISTLIFVSIWILSAIVTNRYAQKRTDDPYLKGTYRM